MDRIPPQNIEAEESILGALLIDKNALVKIADALRPDDFYRKQHGEIYQAMLSLYSAQEPIDLLTLSNKLDSQNKLEKIGGRTYLAGLASRVPSAGHVKHYADIIQKKASLRKLQQAAAEISELSFQEDEDIDKILDLAEQSIFGVSQSYLQQNFSPVSEVLNEAFERIDKLHKDGGKLRGVPSGFPDLDDLLAGFQKSDLIILAARPSVGKTTLALDFARHAAVHSKVPVGLFSLEMSKEQLVDRLLCTQAGVPLWKMRTGKLSDSPNSDDFPRLGTAMGVLSEAPIFIDDNAAANVMEIRTKCRRLQTEHGLGMIIIDYLQLMEGSSKENRTQEISQISRALKQIARELNVPIIALSQLSRAVEQTKPAIPKLSHLRESGSIEQDADIVMFVYRKAADRNYRPEELTPEEKHLGEIHIAKHRNGPTGVVKVFFDAEHVTYKSLEKKHMQTTAPPPLPPAAPPAPPAIDLPKF
jgi:replicative DNA helicase